MASRPRAVVTAVALVVLVLLGVGAVLAFNDDSDPESSPQAPIQAEKSPAEQAEDLSAWLRENSRPGN